MKQFERLAEFAKKTNIEIGETEQKQFADFCSLLIEQNKVMNLTAIENPKEIEIKHFIDSLEGALVIRHFWRQDHAENEQQSSMKDMGFSLIDVGTGAGFPGIPLKIVFPKANFTLLDSLNKRITFLEKVIKYLDLNNINAVAARAEDLAKEGSVSRETFDFVTSRAVASLPVLLEYCLPFVKEGGYGILYKSSDYKEELDNSKAALDILGGQVEDIKELVIPGISNGKESDEIRRSIIIIKKIKATPIKYPRRSGKPLKSPIH